MKTNPVSATLRAALAVAVALLAASPAAADAVHWQHLDAPVSAGLASAFSTSFARGNLKRTGDLTTESRRAYDSSWNRYAYVLNNPLKFVDPDGRDVFLANRLAHGSWGFGGHAYPIVQLTGKNRQRLRGRAVKGTNLVYLGGQPVEGKLKKAPNFLGDIGKATQLIAIPAPEGMSMEQFEQNIIEAFDSYQDDAPYEGVPGAGTAERNSNSLASGILDAAGVAADKKPTKADLDLNNSGWDKPVVLPDATADDVTPGP